MAEDNIKKEVEVSAKSLEDALKGCAADLDVWNVDRYAVEQNTKGFNYKISFTKKESAILDVKGISEELRKTPIKLQSVKYPKHKDEAYMAEVNISDLHLGKLCWDKETGNNYDLKITAEIFKNVIEYKVRELSRFSIEKIVFPLGNDFYHIDNYKNTTTQGTPQDVDSRFPKIFQEGIQLIVWAINQLRQIAPVEVILVSGNHGRFAEQALGGVISAYFNDDKNVTVDENLLPRKYIKYGQNLIGYLHGDEVKVSLLPILMATEAKHYWADTKYRYIKMGHFHTNRLDQDEICGIGIYTSPSLCGTDAWHMQKGYTENVKSAISTIYSKERGAVYQIIYNL